jgi:SHS2 domain-containing protein
MKCFEVLDHTADIGILVYGEDLQSVFQNTGGAFFHQITDLKKDKTPD